MYIVRYKDIFIASSGRNTVMTNPTTSPHASVQALGNPHQNSIEAAKGGLGGRFPRLKLIVRSTGNTSAVLLVARYAFQSLHGELALRDCVCLLRTDSMIREIPSLGIWTPWPRSQTCRFLRTLLLDLPIPHAQIHRLSTFSPMLSFVLRSSFIMHRRRPPIMSHCRKKGL